MIRAVIFDCFGVFYVDPVFAYMHDPATPPELGAAIHDLDEQAAQGLLTKIDFITQAADLLAITPAAAQQQFFGSHLLDQHLADYARSLRPMYRTALLSNIGADMMGGYFTPVQSQELFDEVVLSGAVGLAKPDPRIFQLTCDRLGVLPAEAVMIDDVPANVEGARRAGLAGIVYRHFDELVPELDKLLERTS